MSVEKDGKFEFDPNVLPSSIRSSLLPHFRAAAESDARVRRYVFRVFAEDPDTAVLEVETTEGKAKDLEFSMRELLVEGKTTGAELLERALST